MKIPVVLMFVLSFLACQVIALETQRDEYDGEEDKRDPRGYDDMRDPRGGEDMRDPRGYDDMRDPRGGEDMRDPRGEADMRDPRGEEDMRDPRKEEGNASVDRPWRETLRNCREMKKAGTLSAEMKRECKAARDLRKASK